MYRPQNTARPRSLVYWHICLHIVIIVLNWTSLLGHTAQGPDPIYLFRASKSLTFYQYGGQNTDMVRFPPPPPNILPQYY